MIGQFPWDPFPPGEPDPKGPDPIPAVAYRGAVTAADAYHALRLALRRESGTLRVGNRFFPDGRFRELAFLAVGNAANSMALAALHAVGQRLTQGFLAGPEPVAAEIPFRGVIVPRDGRGRPSPRRSSRPPARSSPTSPSRTSSSSSSPRGRSARWRPRRAG